MTYRETIYLITNVMAVLILFEMIVATIAVMYISTIYVRSTRESTIFRMLIRADIIKVIAGVWIGFLAVYRLAGGQLPDWTPPISATVVAILLAAPILHAVTIRRLRRRHGDGSPPPLIDGD